MNESTNVDVKTPETKTSQTARPSSVSKRRNTSADSSATIRERLKRADSVIPMLNKRTRSRSSFGTPTDDSKRPNMADRGTPTPSNPTSGGVERPLSLKLNAARCDTPSRGSVSAVSGVSGQLTRKDSVRAFGDAALMTSNQKRLMLQGKLLQKKVNVRKQSLMTKEGMKSIMNAPTIVRAFQAQNSPFVRFRRVARAVKLLIQVCHVCKGLLEDSVSQEAWFALVDNLATAAALTSDKKKGRAFVTFVPNENRELEQLSFDVTEYLRHKKAEDYLTDEVRNIMKQRPGTRTDEQLGEVVRCLKNICKSFNEYPLSIQKDICQRAFYDQPNYGVDRTMVLNDIVRTNYGVEFFNTLVRTDVPWYRRNRVILRRGLAPDGIYFLLSGQLVEKPEGRKQPEEIDEGEKFGEEELICGSSRRATVLSKNDVEILFLHRVDYRLIFNMSTDSVDPKNLEICKQDAVFQHFPMHKLLDNPGTWSSLKYKYGRLIVKDSNDIEWIYVIKSGEARVLKHLEPGRVDVKARRKKIQKQMEDQSSYHKQKKILDFIADGTSRKSCYSPSVYDPATSGRRATLANPRPVVHRPPRDEVRFRSQSAIQSVRRPTTSRPDTKFSRPMTTNPASRLSRGLDSKPDVYDDVNDDDVVDDDDGDDDEDSEKENKPNGNNHEDVDTPGVNIVVTEDNDSKTPLSRPRTRINDEDNGQRPTTRDSSSTKSRARSAVDDDSMALPPFVQIETLHPGHTFGLRSCLEHDERGPSVSLVSGECEVLAINKKFFMKHCDDALISLIRLKAKPFPSQTELVDRLDANMQWEEFKQETLKDFLRHRVRVSR